MQEYTNLNRLATLLDQLHDFPTEEMEAGVLTAFHLYVDVVGNPYLRMDNRAQSVIFLITKRMKYLEAYWFARVGKGQN